jgi:serine/threonine protein phosphatase PrpC
MGMQGWRRTMEDSHIAHTDLDNGVSLFGVFDGHGGKSFSHLFQFADFGANLSQFETRSLCIADVSRKLKNSLGQNSA